MDLFLSAKASISSAERVQNRACLETHLRAVPCMYLRNQLIYSIKSVPYRNLIRNTSIFPSVEWNIHIKWRILSTVFMVNEFILPGLLFSRTMKTRDCR